MKRTGLLWGAGGFGGFTALAVAVLAINPQTQADSPTVAREGLSLAGVAVAGKSQDEVREIAAEISARLLAVPLRLRYKELTTRITPAMVGAAIDTEDAVATVFAPEPPPANLLERIRTRFTEPEPINVPLAVRLTEEGVRKGLPNFTRRVAVPAQDARLTRAAGQFKRTPPKPGRELDMAALLRTLRTALDAPELMAKVAASLGEEKDRELWLKGQEVMELPASVRDINPRITLEHLKPITNTLASFTTSLSGTRNRVHNIALAARAIDGTVLLPGDVFSYNDVVGPRTGRAGYREAPQIVAGQLVDGTGGGICQVSSTLYNAALLADMKIVRRSHHAFPVAYVPAGRDATVSYGSLDFRFRNDFKNPVAVDAKVEGGRVRIALLGHLDDKRDVEIVSSGVTRGRTGGARVTITRVVKQDGEVLRREVIARDAYRPKPAPAGRARSTTTRTGTRRKTTSESPVKKPAAVTAPSTPARTDGAGSSSGREGE